MIRKILMFMLLVLHFSNADRVRACFRPNIDTTNFSTFKETCHALKQVAKQPVGTLLSKSRICIPGSCNWMIQFPPNKDFHRNLIDIEISDIQVIEIDVHTITLRQQALSR